MKVYGTPAEKCQHSTSSNNWTITLRAIHNFLHGNKSTMH